jgi:diguanylate cyclase (GGDEF)-like protein
MEVDKSGLDDRVFSALADTSERRYLYLCNLQTGVVRWSPKAVAYFGLPGEYVCESNSYWVDLLHPEDRENCRRVFAAALENNSRYELECRIHNKQGDYVFCVCRGNVVRGANGEPDLLAGTLTNYGIMDRVDAVTHLHNLYAFLSAMRQNAQTGQVDLVMMIAINQFQTINEIYGYRMGNRVLRAFARQLRDFMRERGEVYRLDGAKFALCFSESDVEQAREDYRTIQQRARQLTVEEGKCIPVGVSGGAMVLDDTSAGEYAIRACLAYAQETSKKERHSELVFFNSESERSSQRSLSILEVVRESVFNHCDGFELYYQPLVRPSSGEIIGMEALIRWHKEPYGLVPPNEFIPWLEKDECFFELGNWILRRAMCDAKEIVAQHPQFVVNVNVAYTQLDHSDFRASLLSILEETGFPPQNLCIELTERCRALDSKLLKELLEFMAGNGIRVALDDFGTGSAALELLRELPINTIKLDRSFISDIRSNRATEILVGFIVEGANSLGMGVCIEGIEDKPLRDFVQRFNVSCLQGYYYSKPVPFAEFKQLMAHSAPPAPKCAG